MPITIRLAETEEDRQRVFQFRYEIYVKEMGKPMPGADHQKGHLSDACDNGATHIMAWSDGDLVGSLRIIWGRIEIPEPYAEWYGLADFMSFPPEVLSFTGRMMVAPDRRNSLIAAALASEAFRLGCEQGVKFDFIHTTPPLLGFFERLGHRRYRPDFIDPKLGPRVPMLLTLEDREHLKNCRSPLLRQVQYPTSGADMSGWFQSRFGHSMGGAVV